MRLPWRVATLRNISTSTTTVGRDTNSISMESEAGI